MQQDYNKTLNLPKTKFPMRAGLPSREPETLKKWYDLKLYERLIQKNEGKPKYILHDGPPYANGIIHLGTALNKILKDFIIRYKSMTGYQALFVPGYDTHGLPTELKARQTAGIDSNTAVSPLELRKICREFALKYSKDQTEQFKRLGVLGEWDNPYLTLSNDFVAKQIEVFGKMAEKCYIYKRLKPVYWCPHCRTALAEAEIEYHQDPCHSIYVKFAVTDDLGKLTALGADLNKTYFVIWTTTTWTLPGNVAICVGPEYEYSLVKANDEFYVMASELIESTLKAAEIEDFEVLGTLKGSELEYMKTAHPFLDRTSLVIVGDHATLESGTGCVHTAPGHGVEDFEVCRNYKDLPVVVPVDHKGVLTDEAGEFSGLTTDKANKAIAERLEKTNNLFAITKIIHQYPHCWRCKEPIIYRATEQWFCSVSDFVVHALDAIRKVKWIPAWGEERISSMVKDRSDWCISRQRVWGVPIPIFYCQDCGKEIINNTTISHVAELFRQHGADVWYAKEAADLLPEDFACPFCSGRRFSKETDIMDVWFDSGTTHAAVLDERDYLEFPADLYLEGADQYRGWFQSSLLTSVATKGVAPYKSVITHGWVVDGEGKKMSKSIGNVIKPEDVVDKYGADILRLWVASSDYHADIRISPDILAQLSEVYRKIRNTARFILGNLEDFDPDKDMVAPSEYREIDKWALIKLDRLIKKCREAYDNFEYHLIFHAIHNFCVVDMSNFYLDVLKDRLYVEKADSVTRRAAQTVIFKIIDSLVRLIAPILAFTADEIWQYMPHESGKDTENVMFNDMPEASGEYDQELMQRWDRILEIREDVKKAIEIARTSKIVGASLEAEVTLYADGELYEFISSVKAMLPEVFITSGVNLVKGSGGEYKGNLDLGITVTKAKGDKCERCWVYSQSVGSDSEHPTLCSRCVGVIK